MKGLPEIEAKELNEIIGARLEEVRNENDMTQEEFAKAIKTYQEGYIMLKKGKWHLKPIHLYYIALNFKVNPLWLMALSSTKHISEDIATKDRENRKAYAERTIDGTGGKNGGNEIKDGENVA